MGVTEPQQEERLLARFVTSMRAHSPDHPYSPVSEWWDHIGVISAVLTGDAMSGATHEPPEGLLVVTCSDKKLTSRQNTNAANDRLSMSAGR
jgi:hypothetical protein